MIKLKSLGVLLLSLISSPSHGSVSYKDQIIQEIKISVTQNPDKKRIYCSSSGCVINEESVLRSAHGPGDIDADSHGLTLYSDSDY